MKFIKNNLKVFVSIIVTTIFVGSVSVYATSQNLAKDIKFTPINENFKKENGESIENVEDALDELYKKSNLSREFIKVFTLKSKGQSYTMKNDGYIIGTLLGEGTTSYATIRFNGELIAFSENGTYLRNVSLYAPKGTVVMTRADYGSYDLEIYEWK